MLSPKSENEMNRFNTINEIEIGNKNIDIIFSLAGGGTNGIASLEILRVLDKLVKKKSNGKVDILDILWDPKTIVAGTSTGSIITALVKNRNRINPDTGEKYTIENFQGMYDDISPKIFTPGFRWLAGCCIAPFSRSELDRVSKRYLGPSKVRETPGLVIMAFNKTKNRSELIAADGLFPDYTLGDAAEASSAIPCAFAPKMIKDYKTKTMQSYSDGGSCLINLHPTFEALRYYKLLRKNKNGYYNADNVVIVDIGAGTTNYKTGTRTGCLSSFNLGGLCSTICDGTCCEICQHIQRMGPELVQEMTNEEPFNLTVFQFDFPEHYPLAFTQSCLNSAIKSAYDSVYGSDDLERLAELLVAKYKDQL
jgi:patatin-like phospholipase/acyl hydrolase